MLACLASGDPRGAWAAFLDEYAPLLMQVARLLDRDADHAADCFLYICEQLAANRFARLRKFKVDGAASFPTWLRAVARNLSLDWHRKTFGRRRAFQSVQQLPEVEQEVYRCRYERGLSADETWHMLQPRFAQLTREEFAAAEERVRESLSARQQRLLVERRGPHVTSLEVTDSDNQPLSIEPVDPAPDPELQLAGSQQREALERAVARLDKRERLLLRLRYDQGLTLDSIARMTGLGTPQAVDRRIREVLAVLRGRLQ